MYISLYVQNNHDAQTWMSDVFPKHYGEVIIPQTSPITNMVYLHVMKEQTKFFSVTIRK